MVLLIDTFYANVPALEAQGWVFTEIRRYDPTVIVGLTPSGKAFTCTMAGSTVSLTIAGNTRTVTVAKSVWEPGNESANQLRTVYLRFPPGQR